MLSSSVVSLTVEAIVRDTYSRLSTPGSEFTDLFCDPDLTIVGSGVGEVFAGPEAASRAGAGVATAGFAWDPGQITIWEHGDVAWAQILGSVTVKSDDGVEAVPYSTTAVFGRVADTWRWKYWGGSEPQDEPRV
jgi:hypothetical protein